MKDITQAQTNSSSSKKAEQAASSILDKTKKRRATFWEKYILALSWERYIRLICGVLIPLILITIIIKLANSSFLTEVKVEVLLLALAVAILIPYVSEFEALGVKVSVREKIDKLSGSVEAYAKAHSYYSLGSEHEEEGDLLLAEKYYLKSWNEDETYWPSLVGLGAIYHKWAFANDNPDEYSKAIAYYRQVLELEKDNVYANYNLADIYLNGSRFVKNAQKALECANRILEIIPSYYDASYLKALALNNLKTPENYVEARDLLQALMDAGKLAADRQWVMYELYVAKSNLGNAITTDELKKLLDCAKENGVDDRLLYILSQLDEQERFSSTDLPVIQRFLKDNTK